MKSDPPPMVVKDPDDHMGSTVWALPHNEADWASSDDGAYGFFFDIPLTNRVSCLGWEPCTPSISVPINLRARVQFCLYREGIAEKDLKVLCPPYKDVRPYVK